MSLHCKKCLCSRTGDVLGDSCQTPGCDGIIEETPSYRSLVNELPEPMTCGRRFDMYFGKMFVHADRESGQDHWEQFKTNGNRVCSYCGSLHPDDFLAMVKTCAEAPIEVAYMSVIEIEPSDKKYKVYVHQPGVRNAHEGGIKFYMQHLPRDEDGKLVITEAQNEEYNRAVHATKLRFERYMNDRRAEWRASG